MGYAVIGSVTADTATRCRPRLAGERVGVVETGEHLGVAMLDHRTRLGMREDVELVLSDGTHDSRRALLREAVLRSPAEGIFALRVGAAEGRTLLLGAHRPSGLLRPEASGVVEDAGVLVVRRAQH